MNEPAPILTPAQVQEIEMNFDSKLVRTHWGECWKCHPECAIARLVASHRALERIVDDNAQCCEERRKAEADEVRKDLAKLSSQDTETQRVELTDEARP